MLRLRLFWTRFVRRHRAWYALGFLCLLATNALTVAIPGFVGEAVDRLGQATPESQGDATAQVSHLAILIALSGLGIIVVRTLSRILFFNPGRRVEFDVKNALFTRLLGLPQTFFDVMRPGELLSRGTNDTNFVRALAGFGTLQLFNVSLLMVFTLVKMALIDLHLTLVCTIPLAVAALVLRQGIRAMYRLIVQAQAQVALLSDRVLETYNSVAMLQAHGAVAGATAGFNEANEGLLQIGVSLMRIRAWLLPVVQVVGSLCIVLLLTTGAERLQAGAVSLGDIAAFSVYIGILVTTLTSLGWLINSVQRGWVALGRVNEVLEAEDPRPGHGVSLPPPEGLGHGVIARDLTFQHAAAATPSIQGISFEIKAGQVVGIFGRTGAGKSTLLDLLCRVYDPPRGSVQVGPCDVIDVTPQSLWRRVAYVTQRPYLFSESIRANILLGAPGEEDPGRLLSVLEDACLTSDLEAFPEGMDTVIGERGIMLSGGQRQRVALARAFYRDFDLLLLDDVLSAVDHATESQLVDAIYRRLQPKERVAGGRGATALIVSHRVSVLKRADRILVLEEGRIIDEGTHEELIQRSGGAYRQAWLLQQAEWDEDRVHE